MSNIFCGLPFVEAFLAIGVQIRYRSDSVLMINASKSLNGYQTLVKRDFNVQYLVLESRTNTSEQIARGLFDQLAEVQTQLA